MCTVQVPDEHWQRAIVNGYSRRAEMYFVTVLKEHDTASLQVEKEDDVAIGDSLLVKLKYAFSLYEITLYIFYFGIVNHCEFSEIGI